MDELEKLEQTVLKLGAALDKDQAFNRQVTQAAIVLYKECKAFLAWYLSGGERNREGTRIYFSIEDAVQQFEKLRR